MFCDRQSFPASSASGATLGEAGFFAFLFRELFEGLRLDPAPADADAIDAAAVAACDDGDDDDDAAATLGEAAVKAGGAGRASAAFFVFALEALEGTTFNGGEAGAFALLVLAFDALEGTTEPISGEDRAAPALGIAWAAVAAFFFLPLDLGFGVEAPTPTLCRSSSSLESSP